MASIGSAPGIILGVGVGGAVAAALAPAIEVPKQDAWAGAPNRILDVGTIAQLVARGGIDLSDAAAQAKRDGYAQDKLEALIYLAQHAPGPSEALDLWRLGLLTDDLFHLALTKAGLDPRFADAIVDRKTAEVLNLGAIATAVHRGIMDDAGLLVTTVPKGTGKVPRIPVSPLDTLAEFAALGVDPERARVLVADTGLPLSLGEMLQLLNRGKVTATDVQVSIAESNVRNEYMDVALELARRLLTPHEYAEAELRGYLTHEQSVAGAGLSGIEPDDYETLFEIMGRPLAVRQITTGEARGGTYGGSYDDVPAGPYRDAIRRSAIRPEYADLAHANRYSYPSLFQISRLVTAGTIDAATGSDWAKKDGLAPEVVKALEQSWAGGSSAADPHVGKAQTQLWTTLHRSYVAEETDDATAGAILTQLGVPPAAQAKVLALWKAERSLVRKQLTPAQVKKAYKSAVTNPATGAAWTKDDATAALLDRGYSLNDATTYLDT